MREETERAEPVVDRNQDDAALGEVDAVVHALVAPAERQPATVNPDHDRLIGVRTRGRRPDVEEEAILGKRRQGLAGQLCKAGTLRADFAELGGRADAFPCGRGHWGLPARLAGGRRSIGNPAEDEDARDLIGCGTLDQASVEFDLHRECDGCQQDRGQCRKPAFDG